MLQIQVSSPSPSPTHTPSPSLSTHPHLPHLHGHGHGHGLTHAPSSAPPTPSEHHQSTISIVPHSPHLATSSLIDLSRNASVISSSSSSSSTSSLVLNTPPRHPRPVRTFSSPRRSRSRDLGGPPTPRASRAPAYLAKELGLDVGDDSGNEKSGNGNGYVNGYMHSYGIGYGHGGASANKSRRGSSSTTTTATVSGGEGAGSPTKKTQPGERINGKANGREESQPRSKSRTKSRNNSAGVGLTADDFKFGDVLGEGSYSTVMHAVYPPTGQEFAIKVIDKGHLARNDKLHTAFAEKNALVKLGSGHPGIVRLHRAFRDEWSLYFVLDLAKNGELRTRISELGSLSLECARYYAAQMVDAVAYMHSKDIIHRDLKPENMLLDADMRLKITDFGTSKILEAGVDSAKTFVGTAQYQAPELLTASKTTKSSDIWAVGCVIFQMIAGRFPFHGLSEYLTWQKIKNLEYTFPEGFDPLAQDLVSKLLVLDPARRLGAGPPGAENSMAALRAHPFFEGIEWERLWSMQAPEMRAGLVKREPVRKWGGEEQGELEGGEWGGFAWVREDGVFGKAGYGAEEVGDQEEGEDEGTVRDEAEAEAEVPARDGVDYVGRYNDYSAGGAEIGPFEPVPTIPNAGAGAISNQIHTQRLAGMAIETTLQRATPRTRMDAVLNSTPFPVVGGGGETTSEPLRIPSAVANGNVKNNGNLDANGVAPSTSLSSSLSGPASSPISIRKDSLSTGSTTSSSEGSPVDDGLRIAMDGMSVESGSVGVTNTDQTNNARRGKGGFVFLHGSGGSRKKSLDDVDVGASGTVNGRTSEEEPRSRGRDPSQTPIQLHHALPLTLSTLTFSSVLHASETPLFDSPIEFRTRTRRLTATSTRIPLSLPFHLGGGGGGSSWASHSRQRGPIAIAVPVPQARRGTKARHLVLTPERVVCVKVKNGRTSVKWEAAFGQREEENVDASASGSAAVKGADGGKMLVTDVVRKGEKGFVVVTNGKSQLFAAQYAQLAERWILEIRKVLDSNSTSAVVTPRPLSPSKTASAAAQN